MCEQRITTLLYFLLLKSHCQNSECYIKLEIYNIGYGIQSKVWWFDMNSSGITQHYLLWCFYIA